MPKYPAVLWRTALDNTKHIPPYDIPETAENDERTGDGIDQRIGGVIAKAVFGNNVNACVAKC